MDIAVINLATQPGRWAFIRQQLQAAGLQAVRHEAVPGHLLDEQALGRLYSPALNRRQYHKPLRPGEIGCYASHLALWQRLAASGARAMAVFEDDVLIDPGLPQVLAAVERLPFDWDIVKLYGRVQEQARASWPLLPGTALLHYRRVPSHTCAYVISRGGAQKLLASRQPFGRPVDIDLRHWWENELAVFGLQPYPVRLAPCSRQSSIGGARRGCSGLAMRLHKLALQARYTLLNWQALRRQAGGFGTSAPGAARAPAPLTDTAHHDAA